VKLARVARRLAVVPTFRALLCGLVLLSAGKLHAATLERFVWTVDGVEREALVHLPDGAAKDGAPLVLAFHGHGGTAAQAARSFALHRAWPEAIVVYPQGLPTPGALTDRSGRENGWQAFAGAQADRDLKFVDQLLADLQTRFRYDVRRVYAMGHSNGGAFTYLLWAERGPVFAAVAPSAAVLARGVEKLTPKPVMHLGRVDDPLVKFAWQTRMIDRLLELNGGGPRRSDARGYASYPSSKGAETATYLGEGGHRFHGEAVELIVKFFQAHRLP
jgi:polyhydroxybutyrate depolymerase